MMLQIIVHRNVHFGRNSSIFLDKQMGNNKLHFHLEMTGVNIHNVVDSTRYALWLCRETLC